MRLCTILLTAAALSCTKSLSNAATMHWGNALFSTMVKSDGMPVTASDGFQFQFGVFQGGFIPTTANTGTWVANWRPLDAAVFNSAASYFTSSFEMVPDPGGQTDGGGQPLAVSTSPESSGYKVAQGTKVYLMVYNNTSMDETTELFLGTSNTWTLGPAADSQLTKPLDYRVSAITQPIFGGANNTPGGGEKTPPGSYALQSATFIPEPGTAMLFTAAAGLLLRRRRS